MTNEELAAKIMGGDRDKLLELWAQVRRFAYQQANRWARFGHGGASIEDLEQTAFLALLDALEGWNPERGRQFLTWYALRLKGALSEATGQNTQRDRLDPLDGAASLAAPLIADDPDAGVLADLVPDPAAERAVDAVAERDALACMRAAVRRALEGLPADQRRAVVLRFWRGESPDPRALNAAMRALRHPSVSRQLRAFLA